MEINTDLNQLSIDKGHDIKGLDDDQSKALAELKSRVEEEHKDLNLGSDDRIYLRYLFACNFNVQKAYDRVSTVNHDSCR